MGGKSREGQDEIERERNGQIVTLQLQILQMKYNWSKRINKKRSKPLFPCYFCHWKWGLTNQHISWHMHQTTDSTLTLSLSLLLHPSKCSTNQKLWWIHFRFVYTLKWFSPLSFASSISHRFLSLTQTHTLKICNTFKEFNQVHFKNLTMVSCHFNALKKLS